MTEMIPLLKINDLDLRQQILARVFEHAYRHRGRMMEIADAIEAMGASQCLAIVLPLLEEDPVNLSPQVKKLAFPQIGSEW